jgi:hypothetical protein
MLLTCLVKATARTGTMMGPVQDRAQGMSRPARQSQDSVSWIS